MVWSLAATPPMMKKTRELHGAPIVGYTELLAVLFFNQGDCTLWFATLRWRVMFQGLDLTEGFWSWVMTRS
jgi:hypothetical protein